MLNPRKLLLILPSFTWSKRMNYKENTFFNVNIFYYDYDSNFILFFIFLKEKTRHKFK